MNSKSREPSARSAVAALAIGLLSLLPLAGPARAATPVAAPASAASVAPADIPAALASLFGARHGSPEAQLGRQLIARWTALSGPQRAAARPGLEASLRELDLPAAVRLASLLPLFDGQEPLLVAAVQAWVHADAASCVAWAQKRRSGPAREAALRAIAALGDAMQPADAAAWAAGELPPGAIQDAALAVALARWSAASPGDAASWAQSRLEGRAREQALSRTVEAWGTQDPKAALLWLRENTDEAAVHDAASAGLVQALAAQRPGEALAVSSRVTSAAQRQQLLQGSLKQWHAPLRAEPRADGQTPAAPPAEP